MSAARWLRALAGSVRGWQGAAVGCGLLAGVLVIAQAGLMAWIVHGAVIDGRSVDALWPALAGLAAVMMLRALAQWSQQAAGISAAARVRQRVRGALLDHVAALGPVRLAAEPSAGVASRLMEQVDALDAYYARYLPQRTLALAVPLTILAVAMKLDWVVALILLVAAPLIPLFMALVGMGAERLNQQQFEVLTRLAAQFQDRVQGLSTLRLFGRAQDAVQDVRNISDQYRRRTLRTLRLAFLSSAVLEFFSAMAIAVAAIYVGFGLMGYIAWGPAPALTLFSGLFVLLLAPEFFQPLRQLAQHYHDRAAALGAARGLLGLLELPAPVPPTGAPAAGLAVDLDRVSVHFDGRGRVLHEVSLRLRPGERLALVGPSGAGKSTLLHLLAGFVSADAGTVQVAGNVAWVGQRPFLMQGTLAENIRLGRPGADDAAVRAAAEFAGVMDFAQALPAGLDTPLGERGYGVSGGQGQRVALARAFLCNAPLLLLDEPTTGLDAVSEHAVLAALRRLADSGRTLVVATHHPAVLGLAQRVLHLDHGRIREDRHHA